MDAALDLKSCPASKNTKREINGEMLLSLLNILIVLLFATVYYYEHKHSYSK